MFRKYYYYYLRDPDTEEIRYVGITLRPKDRYYDHVYNTKAGIEKNTWKANWIKSLLSQNKKPRMDIFRVFITNTAEEAYNLEQDLIEEHFKNGYSLVNVLKVPYTGSNPGSLRKKVYQYNEITGEFIQEFPSVSDAGRAYQVNALTTLFKAVKQPGKVKAHGYYWSYRKHKVLQIQECSKGRPPLDSKIIEYIRELYQENKHLSLRKATSLCVKSGMIVSRETVRRVINSTYCIKIG